jgi:DNA-binding LacI/PurR family transcriptional regulator
MVMDIAGYEQLLRDLRLLRRRGGLVQGARLDGFPALSEVLEQLTPPEGVSSRLSPVERARSTLTTYTSSLDDELHTACASDALNLSGDRRGLLQRRNDTGARFQRSPRHLQRIEDRALEILASALGAAALEARRRRLLHAAEADRDLGWIAVLAPLTWWPTEYYSILARGIRDAADRERTAVRRDVYILDVPRDLDERSDSILAAPVLRGAKGIISINLTLPGTFMDRCLDDGVPVVSVTHHETHPACAASVLPNHGGFAELVNSTLEKPDVAAAVLLTKELVNPLKGGSLDPFRTEKRRIFAEAADRQLLTAGEQTVLDPIAPLRIAPSSAHIIEISEYTLEEGRRAHLSMVPPSEGTTAVIALADIVAIGFMSELNAAGLTISRSRIRLTGYDNIPLSEMMNLSTVDYNLPRVGRVAYDRLQEALDHPGCAPLVEHVDCSYVTRTSSTW